jgi:hypothetical protein
MILDAEMLQAEALLMAFGAGAAHRASDCAHSEAMNVREEGAATWRRVTAFILASPHHALQLTAANWLTPLKSPRLPGVGACTQKRPRVNFDRVRQDLLSEGLWQLV